MTDPTNTCPHCQFNLLLLPAEALLSEPDRGKRALPRMVMAGTKLIESLRSKNPEIFTSKASAMRALTAVGANIFDVLSAGEELPIPARKVITFLPAKALRQRLND